MFLLIFGNTRTTTDTDRSYTFNAMVPSRKPDANYKNPPKGTSTKHSISIQSFVSTLQNHNSTLMKFKADITVISQTQGDVLEELEQIHTDMDNKRQMRLPALWDFLINTQ